MPQWFKNLFAEKKLIAIVPIAIKHFEDDEYLWTDSFTAYCYIQGSRRIAHLVGPFFGRRYVKTQHERWTHCVEPWLKYGYAKNLQPYMVGDYGTTSLDQPKSCGNSKISSN